MIKNLTQQKKLLFLLNKSKLSGHLIVPQFLQTKHYSQVNKFLFTSTYAFTNNSKNQQSYNSKHVNQQPKTPYNQSSQNRNPLPRHSKQSRTQPKPKFIPIRPSMKQLKQQKKQSKKSNQLQITNPQLYIDYINNKNTVQDAVKLLNRIVTNRSILKEEFQENVWKKYCYYVYLVGKNEENMWKGKQEGLEGEWKENANQQKERNDKQYQNQQQLQQQQQEQQLVDNHKIARQQKLKKQRILFLQLCTKVHQKFNGQLTSQNTTKTFNKFADHFQTRQQWSTLSFDQKLTIIQSVCRYNIKKGKAIFLKHRQYLLSPKSIQSLQTSTHFLQTKTSIVRFLLLMNKLEINDTKSFERCIDILYDHIQAMKLDQIKQVLFILGKSHKFVNKDFIIKLRNRFNQLINQFKQTETQTLLYIMSGFSMVEKNLQLNSVFFQPLDVIYERMFPYFMTLKLSNVKSKHLGILAKCLRRCQYFDQSIVRDIIAESLRRQVIQFFDRSDMSSSKKYQNELNSISIQQLTHIFFMLASFNYRNNQFMKYFVNLLSMLQSSKDVQKYISHYLFDRILWSVCVLCNDIQINSLLPLLQTFYKKTRKVQPHQATNYYHCYLLLKRKYLMSQIRFQNDKIQQYLQGPKHEIKISQTQKQIHKILVEMGIPCIMEYNLNNIVCDIYIPKYGDIEHIIVEVHGYHHFMRNVKRINGGTALKEKIIQNEGYSCFYVSLDQWLIAEDKRQFLRDFMTEVLSKKYEQKQKRKKLLQSVQKIDKVQKRGRKVLQFKRRSKQSQSDSDQNQIQDKQNKTLRIPNKQQNFNNN